MGGGGQGPSISESGEMLCLTYFARRPDVDRVLKCAKRKDLYSAKVDRNRQKHTIRVNRIAFRKIFEDAPSAFA